MRGRSLLMFVALVGIATACEDDDVVAEYAATLSGTNEVPSNNSPATGSFRAELNEDNILSYTIEYSGLQSNVILGHIHGPAAAGTNAGVLIDFNAPTLGRTLQTGVTTGTAVGTVDLNLVTTGNANVSGDSLLVLLNNGNAYVNIHTQNRTGGEIRGQIIRQ
jgi:hypothetical protein